MLLKTECEKIDNYKASCKIFHAEINSRKAEGEEKQHGLLTIKKHRNGLLSLNSSALFLHHVEVTQIFIYSSTQYKGLWVFF